LVLAIGGDRLPAFLYRGKEVGHQEACGPAAGFAGPFTVCCQGLVASPGPFRTIAGLPAAFGKGLRRRCALEPGRAAEGKGRHKRAPGRYNDKGG